MITFEGKVVVVTGGNSGIGLAAAMEFARLGARVVVAGRDEQTLASAATAIGGGTPAVRADVSRSGDLDDLFARTRERFGRIDVLFVNAGVVGFGSVAETSPAEFDRV